MTTFNFVFPIWLDFISYFFCVEFGSWVSILSFYKFLFLFWLGCIQYVYCAEFVSWFPILWPSTIFCLPFLFWPDWISISFFWFCLPILTRLDWELSDQWRQICIIAFYRKDLKPIKSWARTITWILLDLANIALAADEYSTEDALFFQSSDFHADSYNSMK